MTNCGRTHPSLTRENQSSFFWKSHVTTCSPKLRRYGQSERRRNHPKRPFSSKVTYIVQRYPPCFLLCQTQLQELPRLSNRPVWHLRSLRNLFDRPFVQVTTGTTGCFQRSSNAAAAPHRRFFTSHILFLVVRTGAP